MNINRHNYETFFLLYIDNELPVAEKKAVDEFVEANPDLQEELVMLQLSILRPDNIVFDDKKKLLKNELNPSGVQEKLLLLLDNELTATERNEIERLIKSDPAIKKEWIILQQTKLLPAKANVYNDKRSLYRKDGGRLVTFPWQRMAVAAVLIGFGVWSVWIYFNNDKVADKEIVLNTQTGTDHDTLKLTNHQPSAPNLPSSPNQKEIAATRVNTKKTSTATTMKSHEKSAPPRLTNTDFQPNDVVEKTNNLPKPHSDNLNKMGSNETIPEYVTHEKKPNNIVNPGKDEEGKSTGNLAPANSYATTTSLTENSEDNNNRVLFMDEEKIKKTKLGGIFRKVKRVLERNANIKPGGNNIKVANLEFAIQ
ncbi:MAG: hypothetical protein ABI760_08335 [Ferruginibacter sp.]